LITVAVDRDLPYTRVPGAGEEGEGRGSFITFNTERSKKIAFPIYAFTANFF